MLYKIGDKTMIFVYKDYGKNRMMCEVYGHASLCCQVNTDEGSPLYRNIATGDDLRPEYLQGIGRLVEGLYLSTDVPVR